MCLYYKSYFTIYVAFRSYLFQGNFLDTLSDIILIVFINGKIFCEMDLYLFTCALDEIFNFKFHAGIFSNLINKKNRRSFSVYLCLPYFTLNLSGIWKPVQMYFLLHKMRDRRNMDILMPSYFLLPVLTAP